MGVADIALKHAAWWTTASQLRTYMLVVTIIHKDKSESENKQIKTASMLI